MPTPHSSRPQAGFSVLELMVALAVLLVLMISIFSLMRDSMTISLTTYEMTDAQESLRAAHEYINRDLIVAGDGLRGINNVCVRQEFLTNFLTKNPATTPCLGGTVNLPLIQSDDDVPANTPVALTAPAVVVRSDPERTDRINILQLDPSFTPIPLAANAITPSGRFITVPAGEVGRINVGEIYFITSSTGATFGTVTAKDAVAGLITFDTGDAYGLNLAADGGPISTVSGGGARPAALLRMRIIHYFIDEKGLLIRRVIGVARGVGHLDSVIAEHVRAVQFRYVLNLPAASGFAVQPVSQLTTPEQQVAVRQVEVTVTTETAHPLASGTRQPLSMTTTTSVRNLQFLETQQP